MWRFSFIIGSFSLRVTYLQVNGKYLVQRFSFVIAKFLLKVTSLQAELSVIFKNQFDYVHYLLRPKEIF